MPFPWLNQWPLPYKYFIVKRYYFFGHRSTDKTCTTVKWQNEILIGRCFSVPSGPGLSSYNTSYVALLLTIFVEFVMYDPHVIMSSILCFHYLWRRSVGFYLHSFFTCSLGEKGKEINQIHAPRCLPEERVTSFHYFECCLDPRTADIR